MNNVQTSNAPIGDDGDSVSAIHPDLTDEVFRRPAEAAYFEHVSQLTSMAPSELKNVMMQGLIVQEMRHILVVKHGWRKRSFKNIEIVESPSGDVKIAVAAGDKNVGNREKDPRTLAGKGEAHREVRGQLSMDLESGAPVSQTLWYLLFSIDEKNGEIRLELSLPSPASGKGQLSMWDDRLFIEPVIISDFVLDEPDDDFSCDVEVSSRNSKTA